MIESYYAMILINDPDHLWATSCVPIETNPENIPEGRKKLFLI